MYPLDVDQSNITGAMNVLMDDMSFVGGAVTIPYKETIADILGPERLTKEAARIGAVNCLFRDDKGQLMGTNTDGEAALSCYIESFGDVTGKNIMQLGCGGAGKAVATYFQLAGANVSLCVRNPSAIISFSEKVSAKVLEWDNCGSILKNFDVVINTTDIGFSESKKHDSPLSESDISKISNSCVVYDIIYDPPVTTLIQTAKNRGLQTLNGSCMNLEQAVIGFNYCFPDIANFDTVRQIMSEEKTSNSW